MSGRERTAAGTTGSGDPARSTAAGDLWQPASSCGEDCIAGDEPYTAAGPVRRALRMAGLLGVMAAAAALLPVMPLLPPARRRPLIGGCARGVLRALGIDVIRLGPAPLGRPGRGWPASGVLVAANHISWLDIVVLLAVGQARLVAKCEVGGWPVIGRIARYTGTIFVDRSRPRQLPSVVAEVRSALLAGDVVVVFPEGTTSCGRTVGRFRPAFFQAAVDAGAAVVPLTLRFQLAGIGRVAAPAFIGDDTVLVTLRRILRLPRLRIVLSTGAMIHPAASATRRALARVAGAAVGGMPEPPAHRRATGRPAAPQPRVTADPRVRPDLRAAPEPSTPPALRPAA